MNETVNKQRLELEECKLGLHNLCKIVRSLDTMRETSRQTMDRGVREDSDSVAARKIQTNGY